VLAAVGANATFTLTDDPAATVTGSVTPPTVNAVFPALMAEMVTLAEPVFVIVRV
jgi:hypothetical protein